MDKRFEIIGFEYFESGNVFTGSAGRFRYRLAPEEDRLKAWVWHEDLCFEKAEVEGEKDFPLSAQGRDEAIRWLEEEYERFLTKGL